jgi:hypothetical protein
MGAKEHRDRGVMGQFEDLHRGVECGAVEDLEGEGAEVDVRPSDGALVMRCLGFAGQDGVGGALGPVDGDGGPVVGVFVVGLWTSEVDGQVDHGGAGGRECFRTPWAAWALRKVIRMPPQARVTRTVRVRAW